MRCHTIFCAALLPILSVSACDPGSEAEFILGRSLDPCLQNLPACPGLFASCELNSTTYAQYPFPGTFRFFVETLPNEKIEITFFFVTQSDAGLDTRIYWYEPGCSDVHTYKSEGENLFLEAEETGTVTRSERVFEGGKHLIEIASDMQAVVDVAVRVTIPGE
jgi:hypothetical protein